MFSGNPCYGEVLVGDDETEVRKVVHILQSQPCERSSIAEKLAYLRVRKV